MNQVDLTFNDFIKNFDKLGKGEWITVRSFSQTEEETSGFYCALISKKRLKESLKDSTWDLHIGDGLPGFSFHYEKGKEVATYFRYDEGIEPLVIWRGFHGMKEGYYEVSEEFRLYFNLFEDQRNRKFILIDDNGDDEDVILMEEETVKIKTRLVKEFVAAKKMYLALFFDFNRFSDKSLDSFGIKEFHSQKTGKDFTYSIGARPWIGFTKDKIKSQGWLMGKKIIPGLSAFQPKLVEKNKEFIEFIIGVDDDGKEKTYTCDEDKLSDFYGKNKGLPNYLTPVIFTKDVLTKYFSQPGKYSVEDGYLRCGGLWGLRMDNNPRDYIMVFLGDLGHLTYKEQFYWRRFNISTSAKMSHTAFMRGFKAEFTDPEAADLYFKQKLEIFQEKWKKKFGWDLFRQLSRKDEHLLKSLHIPLTNEQKEFDEQVGAIVKILIDSLNDAELKKVAPVKNLKSLDKLERFLASKNLHFKEMMEFLRNLQDLRSSGVAHLKGKEYEKIKIFFSIDKKSLIDVMEDIFIKSVWTLNSLENKLIN